MHFLLSLDKNKYAIVTGKHVLGAKRYRLLESTCTQEPSEFGHCQGATMRARYDARRSGNVARMKGERVWRVQGGETRRCTGSRFTFDPWKTRETCSCVTQIANETFRWLNNGSPLRIRERIRWSKVALNRGERWFCRAFCSINDHDHPLPRRTGKLCTFSFFK